MNRKNRKKKKERQEDKKKQSVNIENKSSKDRQMLRRELKQLKEKR